MKKVLGSVIAILLFIAIVCLWIAKSNGFAADIRGTITKVTHSQGEAFILIEGMKDKDTLYDKASVRITGNTSIEDQHGRRLTVQHLVSGAKVETSFNGLVMESYPVQATAEKVIVFLDVTP